MPPSNFTFSDIYSGKQPQGFLISDLVLFLTVLLSQPHALTNHFCVSDRKNIRVSKGKNVGLMYLTAVVTSGVTIRTKADL